VDWYVDAGRPEAVRALRHELVEYLRRHAADPDRVWEAELACDELVSNAVQHAGGTVWVSVDWSDKVPVLTVHDLGPDFEPEPSLPHDVTAERGRGLFLAAHLTDDLARAAKRAGGNKVVARLPVERPGEPSYDAPTTSTNPLPGLDEAQPGGGFGKESFLRALVVQLAQAVERVHGPAAAEAVVAQVGADVGAQMEEEYRRAGEVVGRLTPEQMAECYVRLKKAIDGDFYVIEATEDSIVLGNRACPFGGVVQRAPALCRMTSSVFGGIAARNARDATVVLEERIAVGDPECRVVVHLGPPSDEAEHVGHRYRRPQ
jgi:anti-sigma regulatory factor (Ser/Thr protein kinase)